MARGGLQGVLQLAKEKNVRVGIEPLNRFFHLLV